VTIAAFSPFMILKLVLVQEVAVVTSPELLDAGRL
jgi:hypothetical protein